jgi:putative sigma-54 modulation protein
MHVAYSYPPERFLFAPEEKTKEMAVLKITITGRKVTLKELFKQRVEKRLEKFSKFFEEDAQAFVTVTLEGDRQTVEVTIKNKGMIYRAEETSRDMLVSFDNAADSLASQITRNKSRLEKRLRKGAFEDEAREPQDEYDVVKTKTFDVKPMNVDEAILEMNMVGHEFYAFLNEQTDGICVVYRRKEGGYGLLEPTRA